jgi:uroporphyrinogen decarboxylase
MEPLTSLDRSLRAIHHQAPDRVPVIPQAQSWVMHHYGSRAAELLHDGPRLADLMIRGWQDFGWDGVFVGTDSVALAHCAGLEVEYTELGPVPHPNGMLSSLDQAADLQIPDIEKTRLQTWVTATRILSQKIGQKALIIARGDQGPFTLAGQLRGMEQFLIDIISGEAEEQIHCLLDFCTRYWLAFAARLLEAGAHVVTIGDALASGSLISPAAFEKYAFPYQRRLAQSVHQMGGLFGIHVCGNTTRTLPRLVATGAGLLEFDAPTDFSKAVNEARGRACLLGNVDTSEVMVRGRPQDVEAECRWRMDLVRPGSGFILSTGCAISPDVPEDNLRAMVESAKKYGQYPGQFEIFL